ncbi:hypothetical protein DERP_013819 [Dermatophagoides pteronyssinus]|uniref:Uncharacterized protein n=1 Tax=Dermatophagoides pteronyssinus TaxID=6956 RepID=A0ABQ8JDE2_DERPT|nr:hypothetical protein DERP_013819 [Dermatophagoides pteronyssinus]
MIIKETIKLIIIIIDQIGQFDLTNINQQKNDNTQFNSALAFSQVGYSHFSHFSNDNNNNNIE